MDFEAMVMEILFFTMSKIKTCLFGVYLVFLGPTYFPNKTPPAIAMYTYVYTVVHGIQVTAGQSLERLE
jgi:uncharacterized membrane protein YoaT (DUF817 family)